MPSKIFLAGLYIILSLALGEYHPFSRANMYSTFPNEAHTFYLTDSALNLLPIQSYFEFDAQDLAHNFWTLREKQLQRNDTSNQLGKEMFILMQKKQKCQLTKSRLHLHHRIYFLSENKRLKHTDSILYTYVPN